MEVAKIIEETGKAILKILSLPFSAAIRRVRRRKYVYKAFWDWASEYAVEIKLGHYQSREYFIPKLFESGFELNCAFGKLLEVEKNYVLKLPRRLRNKLEELKSVLQPIDLHHS